MNVCQIQIQNSLVPHGAAGFSFYWSNILSNQWSGESTMIWLVRMLKINLHPIPPTSEELGFSFFSAFKEKS